MPSERRIAPADASQAVSQKWVVTTHPEQNSAEKFCEFSTRRPPAPCTAANWPTLWPPHDRLKPDKPHNRYPERVRHVSGCPHPTSSAPAPPVPGSVASDRSKDHVMTRTDRYSAALTLFVFAAVSVSASGCAVDRTVVNADAKHRPEQNLLANQSPGKAGHQAPRQAAAQRSAPSNRLEQDISRRAAELAAASRSASKTPPEAASTSRSATIEPVAYAAEPGTQVTTAASDVPAGDVPASDLPASELERLPTLPAERPEDERPDAPDPSFAEPDFEEQTAQSPGTPPEAAPGNTKTPKRLSDRLQIPAELPGAAVPPLRLPKYNLDDAAQREQAIEGLFPQLPTAGIDRAGTQPPMALSDFEQLALANNPLVTQAQADVDSAMGQAVQAGLYPNPIVGYQADTVGSGGTANYHGVFIEQQIKTANKLGLARSSALFSVYNAQLTLQKTRVDVLTGVRSAYYNLLTARETLKIYEALVRFTDQAYRVQVEQLKGGQAAAYEPMQLRSLSNIARTVLAQSRNRYDAASRQLAAAVGIPDLQPAELLDAADAPVPSIDYDAAVAYMLSVHPDLGSANNSTLQAQTNLKRACVVPIPDVNFYSAIQKDFTDPTHRRTTWNMQVGVPVPIFDRNSGNIQSAQGALIRASNERSRVRNTLTQQLADAFQKYESANVLVRTYHDEIIPDQSRVYRAVYERHQQEPDVVGFGDIVVAQQTLQQGIAQYAQALGDRWAAYVEILRLLQIEDAGQLDSLGGVTAPPAALEGIPTPAPVD
jgi:outer membrane protein, heavy metal efflux system